MEQGILPVGVAKVTMHESLAVRVKPMAVKGPSWADGEGWVDVVLTADPRLRRNSGAESRSGRAATKHSLSVVATAQASRHDHD